MLQKSLMALMVAFSATTAAAADWSWNCDINSQANEVSVSVNSSKGGYSSAASIDGKEARALPCYVQSKPGVRHVRCSHTLGNYRLEVYPYVQTNSGKVLSMQAILWNGNTPEELDLSNCPPTP